MFLMTGGRRITRRAARLAPVVLRYAYGEYQVLALNVALPWVYVDPSVKDPASPAAATK